MKTLKPLRKHRNPPPTLKSIPTAWAGLSAMYPLRPIHDGIDLRNATDIIDAMAGHRLTADQEDYLDALATLVSAYEAEHYPLQTSHTSGLDSLRSLLEDHQMTAADLGRLLGIHRSHAAKILKDERSLTIGHLLKLSEYFKVEPQLFMGR